jgi:serine/threonine-protein kinase
MELAVSQKLDHPNLIKVIEIGEDPKGGGYLVMELLHGYTVRQILNEKRLLPLALAAEIVCQVADGLSYLHEQKWVHCDITPNNILIDRDNGKAVVFDLGTVQEIGSTQIRRFGTPDYLPPDFTESVPTNPSFDVYNLGATFFEMLLGIRFQDDSQAKIATLMNVRESSATLARQLSRVPDQATRELLERALQPRDRKVTMADFISVLESVRSHSLSEELFKAVSIS